MSKKKQKNNSRNREERKPAKPFLVIPEEIKKTIWGVLLFLFSIIIGLSFFNLAGIAGKTLRQCFSFCVGETIFIIPLVLIVSGFVFLRTRYRKFHLPLIIASLALTIGLAGFVGAFFVEGKKEISEVRGHAGIIGYLLAMLLYRLFGFWVTEIIFVFLMIIGLVVFRQLLKPEKEDKPLTLKEGEAEAEPTFIKRIFATPRMKMKPIDSAAARAERIEVKVIPPKLKTKSLDGSSLSGLSNYKLPAMDLLEPDKENPSSGDTKLNQALIKKTLQNFSLPVEMSEVNIGPTVTQYTLKPAEGIKLSKITTLNNDLSLALASHPLRIEAPIPGRPLVGVEVPNKIRARVRLRNLVEHPNYQNSPANLLLCLGRDVSGLPVYADLARMPHLLVAGATGTGKTIFLNSLILSLLYKNSPELLRFILIDPKKVEFSVYRDLPHLLAPVITEAASACNALRWLVGEMERRFDILAKGKARDVASYNDAISEKQRTAKQKPVKEGEPEEELRPLPYIVLIIDELADLMAARGRDMEAGIVRLAQMARAVGIHLVLATQRPSVEVITGLIKANVTSRIAFQVASQVDSRTILDTGGAEKLLGMGDMLFISAEVSKPKRVQGAYASEKEVHKVSDFIRSQNPELEELEAEAELADVTTPPNTEEQTSLPALSPSLEKALTAPEADFSGQNAGADPLYEEAKKVVIEAKKASASLLQRRLRLGYARAARLIDTLEERGVVGPGEGAKPREVFIGLNGERISSSGGIGENVSDDFGADEIAGVIEGEEIIGDEESGEQQKDENWKQT